MSRRESDTEEWALARLREASPESDAPDIDDDTLLDLAAGRLDAEREAEVLRTLGRSAGRRAYLIEGTRPVSADAMARALAAMNPRAGIEPPPPPPPGPSRQARTTIDPFHDPLAPEPPRGFTVTGPHGRIRAQMDGPSSDDGAEPPRFGPDSTLEWVVRREGDRPLPDAFTLWMRAPGGRYVRGPDPTVERTAEAVRLTVDAARLFPETGPWQIALVGGAGEGAFAPDDCLQESAARFEADPIRLA